MKIDPRYLPWNRLHMTRSDWWDLALAFYCLAYHDFNHFEALPERLKTHPIGQLCSKYMQTNEYTYIDQAGRALTFSKEWYVYLGRSL